MQKLYKNTQSRYLESLVETSLRNALVEPQSLKHSGGIKGRAGEIRQLGNVGHSQDKTNICQNRKV